MEREGDRRDVPARERVLVVSMAREFGMIASAMKAVGTSDGSFGVGTIPGRRAAHDLNGPPAFAKTVVIG